MDVLPRAPADAGLLPTAIGARPTLTVVIVNYRDWDATFRLVGQLRATPEMRGGLVEIVIVDNHSPRHPLLHRLRRAPGVSLRRWRGNRGFARAVNEGCRLGRGEWFLLLNPDVTIAPGFLGRVLASARRAAAGVGIVGFRLVNPDGSPQLSTGRFPTLAGTLARLLLPRAVRKYTHPEGVGPSSVDWVTGCCLLLRRECWQGLGGLGRDFFLYYEDVDLCQRAGALGWEVVYDPTTWVVHHHPLHSRVVPPHLRLITRHALLTYARKHWPAWQGRALGWAVRAECFARRVAAWWAGDPTRCETFGQLAQIVAELQAGHEAKAWALLRRAVREQEKRLDLPALDRHPVAQPARLVDGVSALGVPIPAAGMPGAGGG